MSTLETQMPPVKHADTNGVRMAYHEVGPREGVLVIFCHGFPELAFSWRHQLRAFEAAGRWAIAPGPASWRDQGGRRRWRPMTSSTGPAIWSGLLDHLGVEKAVFCGQATGAASWSSARMPLRHPDRVAGVIGLNMPFMPCPPADPIGRIMRRRLGEEMYIVHFQKLGEADCAGPGTWARP